MTTDSWAIEAHNKSGKRFFFSPAVDTEVEHFVARLLTYEGTGGIVIYRSTVAASNDTDLQRIWEEAGGEVVHNDAPDDHPGYWVDDATECATAEKENPENFEKVAEGNEPEGSGGFNLGWFKGPGGCRTCGCPPDDMPMVNRGTGWCCERHRKEQI